jgi:hypothetical protein
MSWRSEILARLTGRADDRPFYLPDLTLWYESNRTRGTLPVRWSEMTLPQVCRDMGVPIWASARPWERTTPDVEVETVEEDEQRTIRVTTSAGTLTSRWSLGPDGDWWQTEYPVKGADDLEAAREWVEARTYRIDPSRLIELEGTVADDGVVAAELPQRPYSNLLHELLGWGEGLMLLMDHRQEIEELLGIMEEQLRTLTDELVRLPAQVWLSPDNLDGQFVSSKSYEQYLQDSYRRTVERFRQESKILVVHVGGPVRPYAEGLGRVGVDAIEGIAGPPQSDATLADARALVGPDVTLWGGIPQDTLLGTHDEDTFHRAAQQAAEQASGDPRAIIGVADRVPVEAEADRLIELAQMVSEA